MVKGLGPETQAMDTVRVALAAWFLIAMGRVHGPLMVFVSQLYALCEKALIDYGRLASHHHPAFHHEWIVGTIP